MEFIPRSGKAFPIHRHNQFDGDFLDLNQIQRINLDANKLRNHNNNYTLEIWCRLTHYPIIPQNQKEHENPTLLKIQRRGHEYIIKYTKNELYHDGFRVPYPKDQWFQLVLTRGISGETGDVTGSLYINSKRMTSVALPSFTDLISFNLFGAPGETQTSNVKYHLENNLSVLRVYSRPLSVTEIRRNFMAIGQKYGLVAPENGGGTLISDSLVIGFPKRIKGKSANDVYPIKGSIPSRIKVTYHRMMDKLWKRTNNKISDKPKTAPKKSVPATINPKASPTTIKKTVPVPNEIPTVSQKRQTSPANDRRQCANRNLIERRGMPDIDHMLATLGYHRKEVKQDATPPVKKKVINDKIDLESILQDPIKKKTLLSYLDKRPAQFVELLNDTDGKQLAELLKVLKSDTEGFTSGPILPRGLHNNIGMLVLELSEPSEHSHQATGCALPRRPVPRQPAQVVPSPSQPSCLPGFVQQFEDANKPWTSNLMENQCTGNLHPVPYQADRPWIDSEIIAQKKSSGQKKNTTAPKKNPSRLISIIKSDQPSREIGKHAHQMTKSLGHAVHGKFTDGTDPQLRSPLRFLGL